jgi:tetraacyldisaccharide 4'-kinase
VRLAERIWEGNDAGDRLGRILLSPFEVIYRGIVAVRGELYDRAIIESRAASIPVVSVGNLTVGGTGKTPVASWIASRLSALGMTPAIVLRGYGIDEVLVHQRLNPGVAVVVDADRASGIALAAANGATVAVLDDGFQHRRSRRDADIVLVSADSWTGKTRMLPAGPWREPLDSISRASLAVITRKSADDRTVTEVARAIRAVAPELAQAVVSLTMGNLVSATDAHIRTELASMSGKRVIAVSAVGNPGAFAAQLRAAGAIVTSRAYADHHAFSIDEALNIAAESKRYEMTVCTLKDAVKLGPMWPADARPLWYVSQAVSVESGAAAIDSLLASFKSFKPSQPK